MGLASLSLHREGVFMLKVDGAFHCGHPSTLDKENRVQVRYQVDLVAMPTLDEKGFLVDQESLDVVLHKAAHETAAYRESCEELAIVLGEHLVGHITSANPHIELREITLRLSPFPHGGWLSATFKAKPAQLQLDSSPA